MFLSIRLQAFSRVAVLAGLCLPAVLPAATVQATFLGLEERLVVRRTLDSRIHDVSIGLLHFRQTGGTYDVHGDSPDFYAFCIEPLEAAATTTFTLNPLEAGNTRQGGMGIARANQLRELYTRFAPVIHTDVLDALTVRALQVATWEIVRETSGTLDVLSGNIFFSNPTGNPANDGMRSTVYGEANMMLSSLNGDPNYMYNNFSALTRTGRQDVIISQTPEPSSAILLALGLAAVYFARRRAAQRPLVPALAARPQRTSV
jgi:hypothetical protein